MKQALLTSPAFVAAVATLLLNDFVLKSAYPGAITGKLSDFAGLFAFATFATALLPRRRLAVHVATAVAFVAWKSPLADPWIAAWNATMPFAVARVIDVTDLLALIVLPLSYVHAAREPHPRRGVAVMAFISLFAFAATSKIRPSAQYDLDFQFDGPRTLLEQRIEQAKLPVVSRMTDREMSLLVETPYCHVRYELRLLEVEGRTEVRLASASHHCKARDDDRAAMYADFRRLVVRPLGLRAVPRPP